MPIILIDRGQMVFYCTSPLCPELGDDAFSGLDGFADRVENLCDLPLLPAMAEHSVQGQPATET